ncbi:Dipeptide and tripeptide permease A [Streptomyces alboniger]
MDVATTTVIVSVYSAMVYLLAMPGGWLGDRVWGPRKTVAIAAVTIMAGHLVLALPGKAAGSLFGFDFPSSWYQSLNPLFIMALAPVFAFVWLWLNRQGKEPSTIVKFAMALVLIGVSFFFFLVPLGMSSNGTAVSPMWLVGIYFIQTVGELCLSPVGLSVTTKMAPAKYASQMMGVWFLAVTAGDSITSLLSNPAIAGVDLSGTPAVLGEAVLAALAGVAVWMYRRKVKSLMGDVR